MGWGMTGDVSQSIQANSDSDSDYYSVDCIVLYFILFYNFISAVLVTKIFKEDNRDLNTHLRKENETEENEKKKKKGKETKQRVRKGLGGEKNGDFS
jgi:hypothetical protein